MTQEKQKVIRVLKPAQKKKSISPIYYGIAGVTFGIAVTSVLIFSVLGDDSNQNQVATQTLQSNTEQTINVQNQANQSDSKAPSMIASADISENLDHSTEDYDQPQTKLNDIPAAFQKNKEVVAEQKNSQNPFANASSQPKPNADKPTLAAAKENPAKKPLVASKPVVNDKNKSVTTKVAVKPVEDKLVAKATAPVQAKKAPVENDNDVELPKATVQISVTRSVKE